MSDRPREYGEDRPPIPAIPEPFVIFILHKRESWDEPAVYEATRCAWVIGDHPRDRAVYALAVSHGVVRGAYRIDRWHPAGETRWCFDGRPAPELNAVGTSIARIKAKRGNVSPVRFFPDGIPEPGDDNEG